MRSLAEQATRAWAGCAGTWLLLVLLAVPASGQTFIPPAVDELDPIGRAGRAGEDASLPSSLAEVHAFFEGRAGRDLERSFRSVHRVHPTAAMDALILRAGTPVPPGVPAARAALRQSMREDASSLLAAEMVRSDAARERWELRLGELLDPDVLVDEDLRSAAIRAVAGVPMRGLAPMVARHLDHATPRFRAAASSALHELYRIRFSSAASFRAAWPRLAELEANPPFLAELTAEQARSRSLALRLIALSPEAVLDWLADEDPLLRARAADSLSRFVGEGKVSVPDAIDALLAGLAAEIDADAFHAMLENITDLLASSPPTSASVARLREVLDQVAERRQRDLYGSILRALSRLTWDEDPASGEASRERGAQRVVDLFGRCVDRGRPLDPDHVLTGIDALETLGVRENPSEDWKTLTRPARDALKFLLDEFDGSEDVRLAVARAYAGLLADDVPTMVELLTSETHQALRYALLEALREVLPSAELTEGEARDVFDALVQLSDDTDSELRRRALEVLVGDEFRAHVQRVGTSDDAGRLVERLEYEEDSELASYLLQLVASFEQPALVEPLLRTAFFDEWTGGGPRNISEMAAALKLSARGDPEVVMRSARRLLVDQKWERQDDARLVRLESAVSLVASLESGSAGILSPESHATIIEWALELREKGGGRLAGLADRAEVLGRLVDVHLPGAGDSLVDAERSWAMLAGDYHLANPAGTSVSEVVSRYRAASAELDGTTLEHALLTRDLARFLYRAEQREEALAAYSDLRGRESALRTSLEPEPEALAAFEPVFELSDLRDLAALIAQPATDGERELRGASREAFDVSIELVERAGWRAEPGKVRIQDLRDLAERAKRSQNQPRIAQVRTILRELPETPVEEPPPTVDEAGSPELDPTAPLWDGLVRRDDWHGALLELRSEVLDEEPTTEAGPAASDREVLEGVGTGQGARRRR